MAAYEIQVNFENCKSGSNLLLEKRLAFQNAIICLSVLRNKADFELHGSIQANPEGFWEWNLSTG